jgi:hypothetical protein
MSSGTEKTPRVLYLGEEISWDDPRLGDANTPVELAHYFAPVTISPKAIDDCSRLVPKQHWEKDGGIHAFLQKRADFIFQKMPCVMTEARFRSLIYMFEYTHEGPVLKGLKLYEI